MGGSQNNQNVLAMRNIVKRNLVKPIQNETSYYYDYYVIYKNVCQREK